MEIVVKRRQLLRDKAGVAVDQRFQRVIRFKRRLRGRASGRQKVQGADGGHRRDRPGEKFAPLQKRRATDAAASRRRRIYRMMEERHWRNLPKSEWRNQFCFRSCALENLDGRRSRPRPRPSLLYATKMTGKRGRRL